MQKDSGINDPNNDQHENITPPDQKKNPQIINQVVGELYERQLTDKRKEAILKNKRMKEYLSSKRLKTHIESIINEGKSEPYKIRDEKREKKLCLLEKTHPEFSKFCDYLLDVLHSVV